MARGNHGRTIYEDEQVRRLWLDALGEVREQTRWRAHAYVMMDKQYNLLLEIPEAKLKSAPCSGTAQKLKVDLGTEK